MIETLQSSLKQRDGENHQLQWEMSRLQSERNFLMSEVSSLTSQLDNVSFTSYLFYTLRIIIYVPISLYTDQGKISNPRYDCQPVH